MINASDTGTQVEGIVSVVTEDAPTERTEPAATSTNDVTEPAATSTNDVTTTRSEVDLTKEVERPIRPDIKITQD